MMVSMRGLGLALGFAMSITVLLPSAWAQTSPSTAAPSAADNAQARVLFQRGAAAAKRRAWDEAVTAFEAAFRLVKSVDIEWNLALALLRSGRLVEAKQHFKAYIERPDARPTRVQTARAEHLPYLAANLAIVKVRGGRDADIVALDGRPIKAEEARAGVDVLPGRRVLTVRDGDGTTEREVRATAGEVVEIALEDPSPPPRAATPAPSPIVAVPPSPPASRQLAPSPTVTVPVKGRPFAVGAVAAAGAVAMTVGIYLLVDAGKQAERARALDGATSGPPCLFYNSATCGDLLEARQAEAAHRAFGRGFVIAGGALLAAAPLLWLGWPKTIEVAASAGPHGAGLSARGLLEWL